MTSPMNTYYSETQAQHIPETSTCAEEPTTEILAADVDRSQYGELIRHCVDQAGETLRDAVDISSDMKSAASILPQSSHALRSEIIRNANDMSSEEKLTASYTNDDYEMQRLEEINQMANGTRDNKAKNTGLLYLAIAVPFVIILCVPSSRKMITSGAKKLFHIAA